MSDSLKFGTSGLRGLVTDLNGVPAYAYTRAFCALLRQDGAAEGARLLIGRDLRASSPAIAALAARAVADAGLAPVDCGAVPTPALALLAMQHKLPALMVTGSHIPEDRNGLKFYRAAGEIDKTDEQRITALHAGLAIAEAPAATTAASAMDALSGYRARALDFFGRDALRGLTIGVYQHSSVARDIVPDVLAALGATPLPFSRADRFIPVDTEAIRPQDRDLARAFAAGQRLDAIVSTDGDADRPLVADEAGDFLRGDLIGAMTADFLGADAIVTPVTSNSALEECGRFASVVRTRVGSPFVLEGMAQAAAAGRRIVVGFEANGGVLLGSEVAQGGRRLAALPTRDALLPILSLLTRIREGARPLSTIAAEYRFKTALSDRLQEVQQERSAAFIARLQDDADFARWIFADHGGPVSSDTRDGLRLTFAGGDVVHYRPSGNAPELRAYVETADPQRAARLLAEALDIARTHVA